MVVLSSLNEVTLAESGHQEVDVLMMFLESLVKICLCALQDKQLMVKKRIKLPVFLGEVSCASYSYRTHSELCVCL